jgi:hypothetical protein
MSYQYLGGRGPVKGKADDTGRNSGNWTITFSPNILNFTVPEVFVYKINVSGQYGSSFDIVIESLTHDKMIFGNQNSWFDDSDSLMLRPGENLYFFYNNPVADNKPPIATVYLRYDVIKWGMDK